MMLLKKKLVLIGTLSVGTLSAFYFVILSVFPATYYPVSVKNDLARAGLNTSATSTTLVPQPPIITHILPPEPLKAVYMSACYASAPSLRSKLVRLVETTELNAIMIDVKDYSGTIAYRSSNPTLLQEKVVGCRVGDMQDFIAELHKKGIYVIARITVFQDPYYTKIHPELAVHKRSDGSVWKDRKGLSFVDVSAKPFWEYIVALGKESYAMGFDELNFDYIRFPSDGDMKDIEFTLSKGMTKPEALEHFFVYLHNAFKDTGAKTSADLFGMTTTNTDDLNIGQVLERAMPYFDYIAPMVYPSHYPPLFNGWKNPNNHPYDLIKFVMTKGADRAVATTTPVPHFGGERIGTSTPALYTKEAYNRNKLRPWLQDFDYGGNYGAVEVRAQIQATYDAGLTSWMLWDPSNRYTPGALLK